MIGMLVIGHGHFASGISSSVQLIAGLPEKYLYVDFLENESYEKLEKKIQNAILELNDCQSILVFSDFAGGSPFRIATQIAENSEKRIEVITGVNPGMLIELAMARGFVNDLDELIEMAIDTGKDQVAHFEL